ncbi:MAG: tetratricopeptide repeat protein [Alphaproteobacteria bacterium]|nr:tetratricopeptide repeat protein [Alphaproteobacteria bacterium]
MAEIFREIDEELQQEKLKERWKAYGKYAIGGAVLIVAVAIGVNVWLSNQRAAQQAAADAFTAAQLLSEKANYAEAERAFAELAREAPGAYPVLARFQKAAVRGQGGDRAGAGEEYEAIAQDSAVAPLFQELALLLMAMQTADIADPDALIDRLTPIAGAGKPWRYSALEVIAALHLRKGDDSAARASLTQISDALDAPAGARARAAELLQSLPE